MVIAGEISGDAHAARLIRQIKEQRPDVEFFGIGGTEMQNEGVEIRYHTDQMAVLGLTEVLLRYFFFKRVFREMLSLAEQRKPDAILLVDYPGFNLRFAAKAHALGHKIIYYICPQVWAWNTGRIPEMAKSIDRLLAIFPFEQKVFAGSGLKVDFVGHPLTNKIPDSVNSREAENLNNSPLNIAALPGSRIHEVKRILPSIWRAAGIIQKAYPEAVFTIAAPSPEIEKVILKTLKKIKNGPDHWNITVGRTRDVLSQSRAAFVTSGTAVLETALMRCPMIIVYKVNWLTYIAGRMLVKIKHLGIVNVIAGRTVCPEFIQHEAVPDAMAKAMEALIYDSPARRKMLADYEEIADTLEANDVKPPAEIVLEEIA